MTGATGERSGPRPPFRVIEAEGTPWQLGETHGREARDLVAGTIDLYRDRFETEANLAWQDVLELAKGISDAIAAYDPPSFEELQGVAAGSGQPLEAIIAINSRTEILALGKATAVPADQECTSAACLPESTLGRHTLIGRNWDQDLRCLDIAVILRLAPAGQPKIVILTEAGILMREGLNEQGLGVTGNSLSSENDGEHALGMPVAVVRRRMLRHSHPVNAAREVFQADRTFSVNHLLAHESGFAISLEASPREVFWVMAEDGLLVHSNHFLSPRSVRIEDRQPSNNVSTLYRHQRVRSLLSDKRGSITVQDIQEAFRDHFGWPHSVCSHPKGDTSSGRTTGTVASVVMDLNDKRMFVAPHPVCQSEYTEYPLT